MTTTWDENLHPRAAAGQFAEKAGSAPEGSLAGAAPEPRPPFRVPYSGHLVLHDRGELPEWPERIAKPTAAIDFDLGVQTGFAFPDGFTVTFWTGGSETYDTVTENWPSGRWPQDWSEDESEMAQVWMREVHERVDADVYGATVNAIRGELESAIIAHATGEDWAPETAPAPAADAEAGLPHANNDPRPLVTDTGVRYESWQRPGVQTRYEPRPEFDVPAGPILPELRGSESTPEKSN